MATLATIRNAAVNDKLAIVDETQFAPELHSVFAQILGITTAYIVQGNLEDDSAEILGRVEYSPDFASAHAGAPTAYRGDGLKGGEYLGAVASFDDFLRRFIEG
jgi:hypothetical protein